MSRGNEQAFPRTVKYDLGYGELGMTLREYYAGLAMQGMMAGEERPGATDMAGYSVEVADALLAALEAKES